MDELSRELDEYREQIDQLDTDLVACLFRRFQVANKIAEVKHKVDAPVNQPHRATVVERHYIELGEQFGISADFLQDLYRLIHAESCRVQERPTFQSHRER
ncbi:chorismate mutase [Alicyclobacillus dauci]|uniref:Chorismate mutase n=1 Tax=Alicyclobacillus dauci TaxID=1475485 RepID=A0ABY6YZ86_9BACL|nr:chorismate mutase [Alicyclobacillus dauci]WAH35436.1 chorismate mutase [Alicyclobacillus dauci]